MPGSFGKTHLLITDRQSSVINAVDAGQDHPVAYTAFGHRQRDSGWLSLLGFNGEAADPMTGLYHLGNGYRPFSPLLMIFLSPDSWSPFGKGGLNAYAYCEGDPVNRADPTGHMFKGFFQKNMPKNAQTPAPTAGSSGSLVPASAVPSGSSPPSPTVLLGQSSASHAKWKVVRGGDGKDRLQLAGEAPVATQSSSQPSAAAPFIMDGALYVQEKPGSPFVLKFELTSKRILELSKRGIKLHKLHKYSAGQINKALEPDLPASNAKVRGNNPAQ